VTKRTDAFVKNTFSMFYKHYLSDVSGADMVFVISVDVLQFLLVLFEGRTLWLLLNLEVRQYFYIKSTSN